MKYQCKYKDSWGRRCEGNSIKGKDYCSKHVKYLSSYSLGKVSHSPSPISYTSYKDYINSPEWKTKAQEARKRNPSCSLCNNHGELHVHHRTYVRLGVELESDLVVLCRDCHSTFHNSHIYDEISGAFTSLSN